MTVKELIDLVLSQGDNVPESDAGYIDRRRRALTFTRTIFQDAWWARDWPWKRTERDVVVLSGAAYTNLPSNFDSLGAYGGVYRMVSGLQQFPPLEEVPESRIKEYRTGNYTTNYPRIFSMFDQDPVTQVLRLQIPKNDVDVDLRLSYQKTPPKLYDLGDPNQPSFAVAIALVGQTATVTTPSPHGFETFDQIVMSGATQPEYNGTFEITVLSSTTFSYQVTGSPATPATGAPRATPDVAAGNAALNQLPQRFHLKVLSNGIKASLRESKGDARWQKLSAEYEQGLKNMRTELNRFQAEIRQLPSFFGDRNPSGIN